METSSVPLNMPGKSASFSPHQAHTSWLDKKRTANAAKLLSLSETRKARTPFKVDQSLLVLEEDPGSDRVLIAVVDDEPVIALTLAEILSRRGFEAVWFTDPVAALDFFRVCEITLLLSDVTMPVLDGISLAVNTLEIRPSCTILLLSGQNYEPEQRQRVHSLRLGIHVETKPICVTELLNAIHLILAKRQVQMS